MWIELETGTRQEFEKIACFCFPGAVFPSTYGLESTCTIVGLAVPERLPTLVPSQKQARFCYSWNWRLVRIRSDLPRGRNYALQINLARRVSEVFLSSDQLVLPERMQEAHFCIPLHLPHGENRSCPVHIPRNSLHTNLFRPTA